MRDNSAPKLILFVIVARSKVGDKLSIQHVAMLSHIRKTRVIIKLFKANICWLLVKKSS